jgi:hypothetical protein
MGEDAIGNILERLQKTMKYLTENSWLMGLDWIKQSERK